MTQKIFFVLFALSFVSQISPNPLTRETTADESLQLQFREILNQIRRIDMPAEIVSSIFVNFEEFYLHLVDLFRSESKPDVSEVLSVFNNGFGARLLVLDKDYVQIDPNAVETLLLDRARPVVKSLFPKDISQQFIVYGALQLQMQRTTQEIRQELGGRKVPLEKLTAAIPNEVSIAMRATNSTDIFSQVFFVQGAVCNTVVSTAYSAFNELLDTVNSVLNSLTISNSDNAIISVLADLANYLVDLVKAGVTNVVDLVKSVVSSICPDLISSRKRRDLSVLEYENTKLARVGTQAITVRSFNLITAIIIGVVVAVIVYFLIYLVTGGLSSLVSYLLNLVFGSIWDLASGIFNSVFSFSWLTSWF